MNQPVNARTRQPKFDLAFKRQAIELWAASGRSASEIAQELGIKPNRLYAWRQSLEPPVPRGEGGRGLQGEPAQLAAEVAALRRENAFLRQQRDILKKTLGILSEPPTSASPGLTP